MTTAGLAALAVQTKSRPAPACPVCHADTRLFSTHVFSQNAYPKRVPAARIVCPVCLDVVLGRYDFDELTCRNGHRVTKAGGSHPEHHDVPQQAHVQGSKVLDALAGEAPRSEMYPSSCSTSTVRSGTNPLPSLTGLFTRSAPGCFSSSRSRSWSCHSASWITARTPVRRSSRPTREWTLHQVVTVLQRPPALLARATRQRDPRPQRRCG